MLEIVLVLGVLGIPLVSVGAMRALWRGRNDGGAVNATDLAWIAIGVSSVAAAVFMLALAQILDEIRL
jgi:hypothetical protein